MKFFFFTQFGEIAYLATYLQEVEEHDVVLHVTDPQYKRIGEGIVPKTDHWWEYLGKGYVWVFESCVFGNLQDWMREQGEAVVGGCERGDELENDRQLGQKWFKQAGFDQPISKNFTDFESAMEFVTDHPDVLWIMKQNGEAPKGLNHKGKFPGGVDMLWHLREVKKQWSESLYGPIDFDLMEVVEGLEVAASAFFNGTDWIRNSEGNVVGYLNFEEKKEANGDTGVTCGEMGTTFIGCDETDSLFASILLRPEIEDRLREIGFHGVFDINCIQSKDGRLVALEPTCRFGNPSSVYELIEGLESPLGDLLSALAKGINRTCEIHFGVGMIMCVVAKPFPIETDDIDDHHTSRGERLWILEDGEPVEDLSQEQRRHIHLFNFSRKEDEKTGDGYYEVVSKSGYLVDVTIRGERVSTTRDALIHYIKQNVFFPGMKYRTDIGARVEKVEAELEMLA